MDAEKLEKAIASTVTDYSRSHNCGALRKTDIGSHVRLAGWVHRRRDHGGLIFVDLRDRFGLTQLVFNPMTHPEQHAMAEQVRSEWVISIEGEVIPRGEGLTNPKLDTGEIEVAVQKLHILSRAKTPPFSICEEQLDVNEELRLKYRYLDLRRGRLADNLIIRHKAMMATRTFLDGQGFLEISTPILGKSTPEGARDYLVPSRVSPGSFYALPQSPQIFKQLLMVGGMHRYFQIAPCFRDEDLRANRQPEFTQIDIELSYGNPQTDLFPIVENLVQDIFGKCIGHSFQLPARQMTYDEAMERYGTDKPDLRFDMELHDIGDLAGRSSFSVFLDQLKNDCIIKGFCVKGGADISRKGIDHYTAFVGKLGVKGLAWMKMQEGSLQSNIVKFFPDDVQQELIQRMGIESGDLIFMIADKKSATNQALDHLRRCIARDRDLIDANRHELLWVTDFPLFQWNEDEARYESEHHPFTSPHPEDIHLIDSDPLKMRSSSYDLVLNGHELASGSQRIHDPLLQKKIFEILRLSEEEIQHRFGFFVEALQYGTPPHLGCALGLDRVIMILVGTENIRDVIAFPKTQKASDLMMSAPDSVDVKQLDELGIAVLEKPAS
ncbi:MAG: aspartate--tRNA ligase [Chlamydiia bacterium]|nr:aspartate--tRNA ligase [Chlamydiia bacterium]